MSGDWRDERACAGLDGRLGFHYGDRNYDEMMCRRMCASCPVAVDCLSYAMLTEAEQGAVPVRDLGRVDPDGADPAGTVRQPLRSLSDGPDGPGSPCHLRGDHSRHESSIHSHRRRFRGGRRGRPQREARRPLCGRRPRRASLPAGKSAAKPAEPADKGAAAPSGDK